MKTHLFPAIKLTLLSLLFFVVMYGAVVWGVALVLAPNHGGGALVLKDGYVVGFASVGQRFTKDYYFWSRPSAVNYNAAGSGGSNKGPSDPAYLRTVQARLDTFLLHNPGVVRVRVPMELITASGSGLDPDISPEAARVQVPRIAKARSMATEKIYQLVSDHIQEPWLGVLGPRVVNVLMLNIELDKLENEKK